MNITHHKNGEIKTLVEEDVKLSTNEIAEIKSLLDKKKIVKQQNEPVAWFEQDPDMKSIWYQSDQDNPNAIPLYTHPVKELTDEEIIDIWYEEQRQILDFARAILRKTQEADKIESLGTVNIGGVHYRNGKEVK